jgi:hypothetical protein
MSDSPKSAKPLVSRRAALTMAAAGVTAAAAGVSQVASATEQAKAEDSIEGPVVVRIRDASSGQLDVFTGSRRIQVRDRKLAAQLLRAATR